MSVATAVYDTTCHVCDYFNNITRRIWLRVKRSRQLNANFKIYEEIRRFDDDAGAYLTRMNERTNENYKKEMSKIKRITWAWDTKNDIDD